MLILPKPQNGHLPCPGSTGTPSSQRPHGDNLALSGKRLLGSPWCYKSRDHTPAILQHLCVCQKPPLLRVVSLLEVADQIWGSFSH